METHCAIRPLAALLLALGLFAVPFSSGCGGTTPARPVTENSDPRKPSSTVGVYHRLKKGQTLSTLSRAYHVPVSTLVQVNGIGDPNSIPVRTPIFIPGAARVLSIPSDESLNLAWPLMGRVTSPFNMEGKHRHHEGIDIDGVLGQRIRAAGAGRVLEAGREGRYGNAILIDHGEGLTTFYAHASKLLVRTGDPVKQGEVIGEVGRSGNARGTHLHFEARRNGRPVNPLGLLNDRSVVAVAD
ncbi:MAG: LysM peptidoglycan-binding domain-containing M23 family metallopeptidase [Acidobacteria bacterium]|nr:LysM peptidoglycan-binding domain-containing M23 family metallopeptidase [Acidobacteriota bacterium]